MHKKTLAAVGRTLVTGALVLGSAGSAWGASAPEYLLVNKSSEVLIEDATVKAVFVEIVSAKMARLYPTNKWGFGVQGEGGITQANTCVVTARVMLLQRNLPVTTKLLLFKPERMATAFRTAVIASLLLHSFFLPTPWTKALLALSVASQSKDTTLVPLDDEAVLPMELELLAAAAPPGSSAHGVPGVHVLV